MRFVNVCPMFLLAGLLSADAEKPSAKSPAALAFKQLAEQYDKAFQQLRTSYKAVKNDQRIDEAAKNYRASVKKLREEYAPRFLTLAEENDKDPVAIDALLRAAQLAVDGSDAATKAFSNLERGHLEDARIAGVCATVGQSPWAGADRFLRYVLEKNPNRVARGLATCWLANRIRDRAIHELLGDEAEKATAEAERLYEVVLAKYGDIPNEKRGTLKNQAEAGLTELRRLAVGKVAPEIEGEDISGKRFKLSDYRGKVVVLDFWGHWCPDCRAVYPQQRAMEKRLEGKPFVLLGVNSDESKDELKKVLEKRGVTWRYWWDGGSPNGPIATSWNVHGWPTIYVLDHQGVIRYKGHEDLAPKLDKLVDELIRAAEESKGK